MAKPRVEVGIDCNDPRYLAPFWATALGYGVGTLDPDDTYLDLVPPDDRSPVVYLQRVPEPKHVKNRLHLDLHVDDPERLVGDLEALGGVRLGPPHVDGDSWWQVMADPVGNEFCVCRDHRLP